MTKHHGEIMEKVRRAMDEGEETTTHRCVCIFPAYYTSVMCHPQQYLRLQDRFCHVQSYDVVYCGPYWLLRFGVLRSYTILFSRLLEYTTGLCGNQI